MSHTRAMINKVEDDHGTEIYYTLSDVFDDLISAYNPNIGRLVISGEKERVEEAVRYISKHYLYRDVTWDED